MLDITKTGMNQSTFSDGSLSDWSVTLDKEELFTLSKVYTVEQMFEIRDVIEKMMKLAHEQGTDEAKALANVTLNRVVENGNKQLEALKAENGRLALALEEITISEEN